MNLDRCRTIEEFAGQLSEGVGRPAGKFLHDMLRGIYASRSVNLTDVARALGESSELHATQKRLSRNLARAELIELTSSRLLADGASVVNDDTRLIVSTYALGKRYAKKMEYLRSGLDENVSSTQSSLAGYQFCEIIASNSNDTYVPLLTTCWSRHEPGYSNDADQVFRAISQVMEATGFSGLVCTGDRLMPSDVADALARMLIESPKIRFLVSASLTGVEFSHRGEVRSTEQLIRDCELPYGGRIYKIIPREYHDPEVERSGSPVEYAIFIHFGSLALRHPKGRRVTLIPSATDFGAAVPILTSEVGLRSRSSVLELMACAMTVSELGRIQQEHKRSFRQGDFRVMTFERLQLLMTLLQAVVVYEMRSPKGQVPRISLAPHEGQFRRNFLLPEDVQRAERG